MYKIKLIKNNPRTNAINKIKVLINDLQKTFHPFLSSSQQQNVIALILEIKY